MLFRDCYTLLLNEWRMQGEENERNVIGVFMMCNLQDLLLLLENMDWRFPVLGFDMPACDEMGPVLEQILLFFLEGLHAEELIAKRLKCVTF